MNEEQRRTRLVGWLDTVHQELRDAMIDNYVFWELQEIVRANPRFVGTPGLFTQWAASCFVDSAALAVRRQVKDKDSISLRRILTEVLKYPALVSRAHYMGFFADAEAWLREDGVEQFDRIAGQGQPSIRPDIVQGHLDQLAAASGRIEHYADRRVAHYDQRGLAQAVPRFVDLGQSLETLDAMFCFYWLYLKGSSMLTVLPAIVVDWQAIFRFAWTPARPA